MGKIVILDEHTANKIAAGEVVERPASIVKELCENSIDAGATSISVEIKNGGVSYIRIVDNGSGISKDDVEIAFEKHSTSKIRSADDLNSITSMGFRGEALASIAAVSRVELVTRTMDNIEGSRITVEGGNIAQREDTGCPVGTSITVRDLFFNTPVRYKFLKKDYTEAGYVEEAVTRLALGYPGISFKLVNSGLLVLQTPGSSDLLSCAYSIFGSTTKAAVPVGYEEDGIRLSGLAGKPEIARANRSRQMFFINNRFIRNKTLITAVEEAYKTLIPSGKYPFIILNIALDPQLIDVNVHPTKQEVRFSDESKVFRVVYHGVKNTLLGGEDLVPKFEDKKYGTFKADPGAKVSEVYEQVRLENTPEKKTKTFFSHGLNNTITGNNYNKAAPAGLSGSSQNRMQSALRDVGTQSDIPGLPGESVVGEDSAHNLQLKIIGTVFSTYILVEYDDQLYIIDQHAAHERVMFEKLVREMRKGNRISQMLLIPEIVELTHKEIGVVEENRELLTNIGFELEQFGNNTLKVSAVPLMSDRSSVKEILLDLIDSLTDLARGKERYPEETLLYRVACKSAVKANRNLTREEISGLLSSMADLENPYTCPHGRPTAVKMSRHEIEKKFGRT